MASPLARLGAAHRREREPRAEHERDADSRALASRPARLRRVHAHERQRGVRDQRARQVGDHAGRPPRAAAPRCARPAGPTRPAAASRATTCPTTGSALVKSCVISPRPTPAGEDASGSRVHAGDAGHATVAT